MSIPEPEDIGRWMARFNHAAKLFDEKYEDQGFNDLVFMVVCGATLEAILGVGLTAHKADIDLSTYYLHNCIEAAISRKVVSREFEPALLAFKDIRNAIAHEIDYRLTPEITTKLTNSLPECWSNDVRATIAKIGPAVPSGTEIRIALMVLIAALDVDIRRNITYILDERDARSGR